MDFGPSSDTHMCLTTEVLSTSTILWPKHGRMYTSVPCAKNTVGLIAHVVSYRPDFLTQVCLPPVPHLGSEERTSSLGGHPLWRASQLDGLIQQYWYATSDVRPWKCWSVPPCIRDCLNQILLHGWIDCEALGLPGVANILVSHSILFVFQCCSKQIYLYVSEVSQLPNPLLTFVSHKQSFPVWFWLF